MDKLLTEIQANALVQRAAGKSMKQIARETGVCEGTVKAHLRGAYRSLGSRTIAGALSRIATLSGHPIEKIIRPLIK